MEFKKIKSALEVDEKSWNDENNTYMHMSTSTVDLTNEEIVLELESKEDLIKKLMEREIEEEDSNIAHVI